MRKLFCVLLALAIACSLSAFAEPLPETETQEAQEAKLTRMLPVLDGLARVMGPSGNTVYAADDPGFVWAQLYQAAMAQRAGAEGDEVLSVPAETMRTYAAASFAGMTDLPPIPEPEEGEAPFIVYDAEADAYLLTRQDARQIYSVVERYSALDAGILAGIGLYERSYDYRLCGFTCLLTENRAASAAPGSADAEAQEELSAATDAAEAPAETAGADLTDQTPEAETPEAAATETEETAETEAAPETETVPDGTRMPQRPPLMFSTAAALPSTEADQQPDQRTGTQSMPPSEETVPLHVSLSKRISDAPEVRSGSPIFSFPAYT